MLAVYGVPPQSLALEITENILMSDPARSMDCLKRLHEMGVRIVIDDFGTGYSSLSYLSRLPIDELKIDRSFIAGLATGADDVIVRATIDLAHNLGLRVVAEGVENGDVQARLMALGCDAAQGTLIRAPGARRRPPDMDRPAESARHDVNGRAALPRPMEVISRQSFTRTDWCAGRRILSRFPPSRVAIPYAFTDCPLSVSDVRGRRRRGDGADRRRMFQD
jgi:EAL domain-containing protein (putative c-di-GMP-specific phosphodiesterase class I)